MVWKGFRKGLRLIWRFFSGNHYWRQRLMKWWIDGFFLGPVKHTQHSYIPPLYKLPNSKTTDYPTSRNVFLKYCVKFFVRRERIKK